MVHGTGKRQSPYDMTAQRFFVDEQSSDDYTRRKVTVRLSSFAIRVVRDLNSMRLSFNAERNYTMIVWPMRGL